MRVALIGAAAMCHHRGIELLPKFTAQLGDPAFSIFREFLRGGAILDRIYCLARVILEIAQHALQFLLHLTDLCLLLLTAFRREMSPLFLQLFFSPSQLEALTFRLAQLLLQP